MPQGPRLNLTQLTNYGGLDNKTIGGAKFYNYTVAGGATFTATAGDTKVKINTSNTNNDLWTVNDQSPNISNAPNACN